jgi:hypothetical protein
VGEPFHYKKMHVVFHRRGLEFDGVRLTLKGKLMRAVGVGSVIFVVASLVAGCASVAPSQNKPALHSIVAQDGTQLTSTSTQTEIYKYSITSGPFSILVPNTDAKGKAYDVGHTPILICASTDPSIFQGVMDGLSPQDSPCLNIANGLWASPGRSAAGIDLMVSNGHWHNSIMGLGVQGPTYTTLNIGRTIDFKHLSHSCTGVGKNCVPQLPTTSFNGIRIYMIVFVDMNANVKLDPGEYTLIELDLVSPKD